MNEYSDMSNFVWGKTTFEIKNVVDDSQFLIQIPSASPDEIKGWSKWNQGLISNGIKGWFQMKSRVDSKWNQGLIPNEIKDWFQMKLRVDSKWN